MATFKLEDATVKQVFLRRILAGNRTAYERLPYDIVTYDDGTTAVQPLSSPGLSEMTWQDAFGSDYSPEFAIFDRPPYSGVTEID